MIDKVLTVKNIDPALFEPTMTQLGWTGFYGVIEPENPEDTPQPKPETADEFLQRDFIENYLNARVTPAAVRVLSAQAEATYRATQAAMEAQIKSTVTVEVE